MITHDWLDIDSDMDIDSEMELHNNMEIDDVFFMMPQSYAKMCHAARTHLIWLRPLILRRISAPFTPYLSR